MTTRLSWLTALACCLLIAERPAHAYIDPGSASYLYQTIAGTALAAVFLVRTYWHRMVATIRSLVSRGAARP